VVSWSVMARTSMPWPAACSTISSGESRPSEAVVWL
jgi:hypothetical protein